MPASEPASAQHALAARPQLSTQLALQPWGVQQVLVVSDFGLESFRPADGTKLWEHAWVTEQRSTQPTILSESDVMIGTGVGGNQGVRRLRVTKRGDAWNVETVWSTRASKPYFNDGVAVGGHFYGFDGSRFCCVDLSNGRQNRRMYPSSRRARERGATEAVRSDRGCCPPLRRPTWCPGSWVPDACEFPQPRIQGSESSGESPAVHRDLNPMCFSVHEILVSNGENKMRR